MRLINHMNSNLPIILYSKEADPNSIMLRNFLRTHSISFKEFNVGRDKEKFNEMINKSKQETVPVTDVNGEIVIGFNELKLKYLLRIKDEE